MSIHNTCYVYCDVTAYQIRLMHGAGKTLEEVRASQPDRLALSSGCQFRSDRAETPTAYSAAEARKFAADAGWVRVTLRGKKHDLCPVCAPKVVQP